MGPGGGAYVRDMRGRDMAGSGVVIGLQMTEAGGAGNATDPLTDHLTYQENG